MVVCVICGKDYNNWYYHSRSVRHCKITGAPVDTEKQKKYYQKNKTKMIKQIRALQENYDTAEYWKNYYIKNKEVIAKNRKERNCKVECECGVSYNKSNKFNHTNSKKHQKMVAEIKLR